MICTLSHADDCLYVANSGKDLQTLTYSLSVATRSVGLTNIIKKTNVLLQPARTSTASLREIQIDGKSLILWTTSFT